MPPSLSDLDRELLIHPVTEFRVHEQKGPRIVKSAAGIRLEMEDGHSVIDGFSGLFNINAGHGRREIADAVTAQMQTLPYYPAFWDFSSEPAIRLAERLSQLLPPACDFARFLFTSGGSDANETNIRLARLYHAVRGQPERQKILSRRSAFHGITRAAGSATTLPVYHAFAPPDPLHVASAAPYCFRCEFDATHPECGIACAQDVETVLQAEGPESVAAVIAEPVLGTGGIVLPPPGYFERLQEICAAHDILLILDEVITGFGRTGTWWGMEQWDIRPDLLSFAKGITSGYLPLGGVAIGRHVYETIRDESPPGMPFMGGLTYNNHPSACAAGLANLDILEREGLVDNARVVGAQLLEGLRDALGAHPLAAEIRGVGMLIAIECAQPGTKRPAGGRPMAFPAAVAKRCWERGLIVRALWENVALAPPLSTTPAEAREILEILRCSFEEVAKELPAT